MGDRAARCSHLGDLAELAGGELLRLVRASACNSTWVLNHRQLTELCDSDPAPQQREAGRRAPVSFEGLASTCEVTHGQLTACSHLLGADRLRRQLFAEDNLVRQAVFSNSRQLAKENLARGSLHKVFTRLYEVLPPQSSATSCPARPS